ncbi:helix-turn-helix transcriptional regulator [Haladaptatus sp. NG-SE-30]
MPPSDPLEDVAFLARSAHRVNVLEALAEGPLSRPKLHEETGISQPTLGRILGSFEDRNWVEHQRPDYALTPLGELLVSEFGDLLDTVETIQKLGDVVRQLPTDEMDFDIRTFADATVWTPDPGDTLSHIRRMETTWLDADRRRLLGSTLGPISFDERKERARRDFDRLQEMEVETIVSRSLLEQGMSDPEIRRMTLEAWDSEQMKAYLYDGHIPLLLTIADDTAMLAPTDENGIPTAVVETENETIRSWVETRLDEYREQSVEMTVEDILTSDLTNN